MSSFKVGDWVKSTKFTHMKPSKVQSIYKSNEREGDFGLKCGGTVHYASESELWQPRDGEWVVVYDKEEKSFFVVVKYDEEVKETLKDPVNNSSIVEPFIGELPSLLKEVK